MSKIAATIVMAQLPNPATKENITMVCEHLKRSLNIYMESNRYLHTSTISLPR